MIEMVRGPLLRTLDTEPDANTLRGRTRSWWSRASGKNATPILVVGTVALVLLTTALLIVALLLRAGAIGRGLNSPMGHE